MGTEKFSKLHLNLMRQLQRYMKKFMFEFWHRTHFEHHIRKSEKCQVIEIIFTVFSHLVYLVQIRINITIYICFLHVAQHNQRPNSLTMLRFDGRRQIWPLTYFWVSVN